MIRWTCATPVSYTHLLDTLGSTFKLLLDYNRRNGDDHSDYHSLYSGFRNLDSTYRSDIITLNNIYSATADFDIALSKVSKPVSYTHLCAERQRIFAKEHPGERVIVCIGRF